MLSGLSDDMIVPLSLDEFLDEFFDNLMLLFESFVVNLVKVDKRHLELFSFSFQNNDKFHIAAEMYFSMYMLFSKDSDCFIAASIC